MPAMLKEYEFVGKKFNSLTISKFIGILKKNMWCEAICECGKVGNYKLGAIKNGGTKSCGCLKINKLKNRERNHGLRKHPLYNVWNNMMMRCINKNNRQYKDYGGRGVRVCNEWAVFINFYNWAVINGWNKDLEIDKDILSPFKTGLIYSPEYCCFVTSLVNMNNRSISRKIIYNGTEKSISEWSRELGIHLSTLAARLNRGWSANKAIETPPQIQHKSNNQKMTA